MKLTKDYLRQLIREAIEKSSIVHQPEIVDPEVLKNRSQEEIAKEIIENTRSLVNFIGSYFRKDKFKYNPVSELINIQINIEERDLNKKIELVKQTHSLLEEYYKAPSK